MCLTATSKRQLATKDIVVYKRLEVIGMTGGLKIRSPYRHTAWEFEELKKANTSFKKVEEYTNINRGLHAYISKEKAKWYATNYEDIFRCIIPKGSYYVLGNRNDIVSNQLQLGNPIDRSVMYQLKKQYGKL